MPRFVILEHDHPFLHWDFMLEIAGVLRTWRLPEPPRAEVMQTATALGDHRLAYLEYEGPLSGERGRVKRWDCGVFSWVLCEEDQLQVALKGARVQGMIQISRVCQEEWQFHLKGPASPPSPLAPG